MRVEVLVKINVEVVPDDGKLEAQPTTVPIEPGTYKLLSVKVGPVEWLLVEGSTPTIGLPASVWEALIKATPQRVRRLRRK